MQKRIFLLIFTTILIIAVLISSLFIVGMSIPLKTIWEDIQKVWGTIIGVLLILSVIAAVLAYRFSVMVTIPIKEMTSISSQIAHGQFGKRIQIKVRGDMGELSTAFNQMTEKLEQSVKQQKDKNSRLEAVLTAMANGIIAVDRQKRITMINSSAEQMFQIHESALGFYIHEIIRSSELVNNVNQALEEDKLTTFEFHFHKDELKILMIYITPMKEDERITGAVVLIHDITELRKLEQMRSDFVANVSHELKTPLTSIKGFIETLQTGAIYDTDTAIHFMDIINIEADRLTRLINDILSLSELESRKGNFSTEKVQLNLIIKETMEIMKSHATDKSIDLKYQIFDRKVWVKGNRDLLKQMMINLVDNAIKYTPSKGSVTVWMDVKDQKVYLHIKDTGIGIATEHISRIFERFYRVDKGRSRSLGGTGLGLAIVKHIVKSMDGDIKVESKSGKGTEFIVCISCQID